MSEWQPIETGPRDRTSVLLWWPEWHGWPLAGYYDPDFDRWEICSYPTPSSSQPTHWMELPAPPQPSGNPGEVEKIHD